MNHGFSDSNVRAKLFEVLVEMWKKDLNDPHGMAIDWIYHITSIRFLGPDRVIVEHEENGFHLFDGKTLTELPDEAAEVIVGKE